MKGMSTSPSNTVVSPSKIFSPVNVPDSPLSCQQGQLTGVPRRVRDSAADLFNSIQEWNRLHLDGMAVLLLIKEKKLQSFENKEETENVFPQGLQEYCDKLDSLCSQLNAVAVKIKSIRKNFEAIKHLEEMKKISRPIFITWSAEKYVLTAQAVSEAYEKEAALKTHVKENVAHMKTKEDIMLHCALWAHQPYIDSHLDFSVEAMLKETGHR